MTVIKNTEHVTEAKARIPGHLKDAGNFNKIVEIFANRFQELEDELDLLLNNMTDLAINAIGAQLDIIGVILNLTRIVGENDPEYRIRLLGQAAVLAKSGEPETIIDAYKLITVADLILLVELPPATVELTGFIGSDIFTASQDAAIIATMQEVVAGGVGTILQIVEDIAFLFGDSADADANGDILPSTTRGLGGAVTGTSLFLLGDATDGKLGQTYNKLTASKTIPSGESATESTTGGNFARVLI